MRKLLLSTLLCLPVLSFGQNAYSEVSIASGIDHMYRSQIKMGGGAAWFDLDKDGDEDLIMTGGLDKEGLYLNLGNGQFQDITYAAGLGFLDSVQTMGVITGDIDNDGYREIFFTTADGEPNVLLKNNGNNTFSDISVSSGIAALSNFSTSAIFVDVDNDGLLDIYVGNYVSQMSILYDTLGVAYGFDPVCEANLLWVNQGNLSFLEEASSYGFDDTGCLLALVNTKSGFYGNVATGPNDIFIANDFGEWHEPNKYYNAGFVGSYQEVGNSWGLDAQMYGMGIAQGDINHDLRTDYYVTNIGANRLHVGQSMAPFWERALVAGVINDSLNGLNTTGWGTAFLDYDNDTWEDLFVANGQISVMAFIANVAADPDKLYRNLGNGTFDDVSMAMGIGDSGMSRGMAIADYDNDGDIDLINMVIHWDTASGTHSLLYRNDLSNNNHYVKIKLEGTNCNRDAIGAMVMVRTANGDLMRMVEGGSSHMSQNSSTLHFGLGTATTADAIEIAWPGGAHSVYLGPFAADSTYFILDDPFYYVNTQDRLADQVQLKLSPNPSTGPTQLDLDLPIALEARLQVWDAAGRLVAAQALGVLPSGHSQIDLPFVQNLSKGLYHIRMQSTLGQHTQVLVKY